MKKNLQNILNILFLIGSIEPHGHQRIYRSNHPKRIRTLEHEILPGYLRYQALMSFNEENMVRQYQKFEDSHHHIRHHHSDEVPWPVKKEAVVEGDLILGGLMMVHEREDSVTCGPIMPQGGVQALETMLYTLDILNRDMDVLPGISLGAHILDDCDKDTYGLEMAVDFIKGKW